MKTIIAAVYFGFLLWLAWPAPWTTAGSTSIRTQEAYAQAASTLPLLESKLARLRERDGAYPTTGDNWVVLSQSFDPQAEERFARLAEAERIDAHWKAPPLALLYRSDGKDYKLIAHSPNLELCLKAHEVGPASVDPVRTYYAFGLMPGPNWAVTDPAQRQAATTIIKVRRALRMRYDPALPPRIHATCAAFGHWTAGALFW